MRLWNGLGILGILLLIVLIVISVWFCVTTSTLIATALGASGLKWWIVAITLFCSLGGTTGGSFIRIGKD